MSDGELPDKDDLSLPDDGLPDFESPAAGDPMAETLDFGPSLDPDAAGDGPLGAAPVGADPAEKPAKGKKGKKDKKGKADGGPGLGQRLLQTSPYVMLLVISLVNVLVGCAVLFLEWQSYELDTKAKDAKAASAQASWVPVQPTLALPEDSGGPITTATA